MARPSDPQARQRLLAAASKVFVEKGLDRAKVEDITHAAGLSKGAFYLHFASKEQAFTEILTAALAEVAQIVTSGLSEVAEFFALGLETMVRRCLERDVQLFEVIWKHRAIMRLVLLEGGGSADYLHLTETLVQPLRDQVIACIELGITRGFYRKDLDPKSAALFCSGGFNQFACEMLRQKKKPDLRAELRRIHRYVARAFGTPEFAAIADRVHGSAASAPEPEAIAPEEEHSAVHGRPGKRAPARARKQLRSA
jgi:AcrR family transcriptional regulator